MAWTLRGTGVGMEGGGGDVGYEVVVEEAVERGIFAVDGGGARMRSWKYGR